LAADLLTVATPVLAAASVAAGAVGRWWVAAGLGTAVVFAGLVALRVRQWSLAPWLTIALGAVLGAGVVGVAVDRELEDDGQAAEAPLLAFDEVPATVPFCIDLTGSGELPPSTELLIFDRSVVVDGNGEEAEEGNFILNKPAIETSDGWAVRNIEVGGEESVGAEKMFYALLVTEETADFIFSIEAGGEWTFSEPPPHLTSAKVQVERDDHDTRPCA
jgi:hypothetical protein